MTRSISLFVSVVALATTAGCAIERKGECIVARDCDQARDAPYNAFEDNDEAFGEFGSCWQTEDTAKPCVEECNSFVAGQRAQGENAGNDNLVVACGGVVEGL